jgi:undecaprenyl-diphosphatase
MPATAAAASLSFFELYKSGDVSQLHDGMMTAFFTFFFGLAAIYFMIRWLSRFGLLPYVVYRILLSGYLLVKFII